MDLKTTLLFVAVAIGFLFVAAAFTAPGQYGGHFLLFGVGTMFGSGFLYLLVDVSDHEHKAWATYAAQRGFEKVGWQLVRETPTGRTTITRKTVYQQNRTRVHTVYRVQFPPHTMPEVTLTSETLGQKALKMLGSEDLNVGIAALDKAFVVRSEDARATHAWIVEPRIASTLLKLADTKCLIEVSRGSIVLTSYRFHRAPELDDFSQLVEGAAAVLAA